MFGIGTTELIVIGVVIFLLFGPTMLPKLMRSIGESAKAFRSSLKEVESAIDDGEELTKELKNNTKV